MAVMMPREMWTDERLDDLNGKVDDGFARLDKDIRELRSDMNNRLSALESRFEDLTRTLVGGFFVLIAAVIGSNAAF